jgi:hypothetical protein
VVAAHSAGGLVDVAGAAPERRVASGRLALALATTALVALAVLGAELVARLVAPGYLVESRGPHVFSETYGWATRAGVATLTSAGRLTLNDRGFRGRELPLPRPGATLTRVVVLGDSVAFGLHVSDEQTFCSILDGRDNGLEVANLAVQGYGPDQELLVLEREGLRLEPDVVVLSFCMANDFADVMLKVSLYDGRTPKPRFELREDGRLSLDDASLSRSALARALQRLSDHSHLVNRVGALAPREPAAPGPHWRERYEAALRDEEQVLQLSLALVRRMRELCRERGIVFLVALMPDRFSYRRKPAVARRFLAGLEADGIPLVDFSARFLDQGLRLKHVALDGTGHLSAEGHRLVSDELEAAILELRPPSRRR